MASPKDTSQRSNNLKSQMKRQEALHRISQMEEYREHLKPLLEASVHNRWLDPNSTDNDGKPLFPTYESFHKAYAESYGRAKAYQEILLMLENAGALSRNIAKQIDNPKIDYSLGTKQEEK